MNEYDTEYFQWFSLVDFNLSNIFGIDKPNNP